jgi:hypothetical protein
MKHIKQFESFSNKKEYTEIVSDIKPLFNGIDDTFIITYNKKNEKTIITIKNERNGRPGGLWYGEFIWKEIKDYINKLIEYTNKENLSFKLQNKTDSYSFKRGEIDIDKELKNPLGLGDYSRFELLKIIIS